MTSSPQSSYLHLFLLIFPSHSSKKPKHGWRKLARPCSRSYLSCIWIVLAYVSLSHSCCTNWLFSHQHFSLFLGKCLCRCCYYGKQCWVWSYSRHWKETIHRVISQNISITLSLLARTSTVMSAELICIRLWPFGASLNCFTEFGRISWTQEIWTIRLW